MYSKTCKKCSKSFETEHENYNYCSYNCRESAAADWNQKKKSGNVKGDGNDWKRSNQGKSSYSGKSKGKSFGNSYGKKSFGKTPYKPQEAPVKTEVPAETKKAVEDVVTIGLTEEWAKRIVDEIRSLREQIAELCKTSKCSCEESQVEEVETPNPEPEPDVPTKTEVKEATEIDEDPERPF